MPRMIWIGILAVCFGVTATGCGKAKSRVGIKRAQAKDEKNSIRGKVKRGAGSKSEKMTELVKLSTPQCPNMFAISQKLVSGSDMYTLYTHDLDVGRLHYANTEEGSCYSFTSLDDDKIRAQVVFQSMTPVIANLTATQLATEQGRAALLNFTAQENCAHADFPQAQSTESLRFEAACKTPDSLTLVRKANVHGVEQPVEIRVYTLGKNEIVIKRYDAFDSPVKCGGKSEIVYRRSVNILNFGLAEQVELRTVFAKLIDTHVRPKQAELSAAVAKATPEKNTQDKSPTRPVASANVKVSFPVYAFAVQTITNPADEKRFENLTCGNP